MGKEETHVPYKLKIVARKLYFIAQTDNSLEKNPNT